MQTCEQLLQEINKIKNKLLQLNYTIGHLSDPELVRVSQELDTLIILYQTQKYNMQ
jgi:Spo0E like sporulation regulatory protein